jgi:integrase
LARLVSTRSKKRVRPHASCARPYMKAAIRSRCSLPGERAPWVRLSPKPWAEYLKIKSPHWQASNRARELRRYEFLFGQVPDFVALPVKAIDQDAKNAALATFQNKAREDVGFYIRAIIKYALTGEINIKGGTVEHHESMPYAAVPAFYTRLSELGTVNAKALQFLILTGARASEVIGGEAKAPATWGEITDVDGLPVWAVPKERMKGGRMHRVPLTEQMVALLGERRAVDVPLFKATNDGALLACLKANDGNGFTVHGMRSSVSDWITETTGYGADLADMYIAHLTRSAVRAAYQRSDQLVKRRAIAVAWSDFVAP